MDRLRVFALYITACIVAVGSGLILASVFTPVGAQLSSYLPPSATPVRPRLASPTIASAIRPAAATAAPAPTPEPMRVPPPPTPTLVATTPVAPTAIAAAPPPGVPAYIEYTVQKGDLLYTIAKRYGVTIGDIVAINQIPNPNSLTIGEVIHIPQK